MAGLLGHYALYLGAFMCLVIAVGLARVRADKKAKAKAAQEIVEQEITSEDSE